MKRTIALKLTLSKEQFTALTELKLHFSDACEDVVPFVVENRCWDRGILHYLCYYKVGGSVLTLSLNVCNAIKKVCSAYKVLKIKNLKKFLLSHSKKWNYPLRQENVRRNSSLFGRIKCTFTAGDFQRNYLEQDKRD